MKNRFIMMACLLLMGITLYSCGPNDAKIKQEVTSKLAATAPTATAEVSKGVVTLTGEVPDDAAKASAEEATKAVKGVKSVTNNLTVTPPPVAPPPPPVEISPDEKIRLSVDSAINAAGVTGVISTIANGEVTLTGEVASKDALKKAVEAAHQAKPKKVNNKITIKK